MIYSPRGPNYHGYYNLSSRLRLENDTNLQSGKGCLHHTYTFPLHWLHLWLVRGLLTRHRGHLHVEVLNGNDTYNLWVQECSHSASHREELPECTHLGSGYFELIDKTCDRWDSILSDSNHSVHIIWTCVKTFLIPSMLFKGETPQLTFHVQPVPVKWKPFIFKEIVNFHNKSISRPCLHSRTREVTCSKVRYGLGFSTVNILRSITYHLWDRLVFLLGLDIDSLLLYSTDTWWYWSLFPHDLLGVT